MSTFFQRFNQGFRSAAPEPLEDEHPQESQEKTTQPQQQQEESLSSSSPSSSTSSPSMTAPTATKRREVTEASPVSRRPSAAMNRLLAAVSQGQGSLINGALQV